jgi:hypothetical protein
LIGIGSIAWLFNISKTSEDVSGLGPINTTKERKFGMNEKASISNEELNTGLDMTSSGTMEEKLLSKYSYPGSEPASKSNCKTQAEPAYKPKEWGNISQKPADPTLDFSILLIAKPIPFKFDLRPRDTTRANKIRDLFGEGVQRGEYTDSREYWGPNQGRDKPLGWSKV